jgi:leader peptidase (prepilin peptidase) / N-methyltransferase
VSRGESRWVRLRLAALVVWLALAAFCVAVFGLTVEALVDVIGCAVLVAVTVTDLERRIVPNRIVLPALAAALVVQTIRDPSVEWLLSALGAGGFFLVLALVYPAGLGMGDVKLAAFLGAWLGWDVFVALFVGTLLGMLPALAVLARRGAAGRRTTLPYVPALAAGAVFGLFFGDAILDAWLG